MLNLRVNQIVMAKLIELQNDGSVIVSFQGRLLRLKNESNQKFKLGEMIALVVTATKPLRFRLAQSKSVRSGLNINI